MANPEVEIYKSVKRFSDYTRDTVVSNVIEKLRTLDTELNDEALRSVINTVESTFEQCNFNGFREVESAVKSALQK